MDQVGQDPTIFQMNTENFQQNFDKQLQISDRGLSVIKILILPQFSMLNFAFLHKKSTFRQEKDFFTIFWQPKI